jgi:predicted kinase
VVSGAPGTGKSTVARILAEQLAIPLLSLDQVKEALADILGLGNEEWSNALGDAAAEVVFRLSRSFPAVVVEGWWRRERRERAESEFTDWVQLFCYCRPELAEQRMRNRHEGERHPIHRDVINADVIKQTRHLAASVQPLQTNGPLIKLDTGRDYEAESLISEVRNALRPTCDGS